MGNIPRCTNIRQVQKVCNSSENRGKVEFYSGSKHFKATGIKSTGEKSTMIIPGEIKGDGTWNTIKKWLISVGIIFILGCIIWWFWFPISYFLFHV